MLGCRWLPETKLPTVSTLLVSYHCAGFCNDEMNNSNFWPYLKGSAVFERLLHFRSEVPRPHDPHVFRQRQRARAVYVVVHPVLQQGDVDPPLQDRARPPFVAVVEDSRDGDLAVPDGRGPAEAQRQRLLRQAHGPEEPYATAAGLDALRLEGAVAVEVEGQTHMPRGGDYAPGQGGLPLVHVVLRLH